MRFCTMDVNTLLYMDCERVGVPLKRVLVKDQQPGL